MKKKFILRQEEQNQIIWQLLVLLWRIKDLVSI